MDEFLTPLKRAADSAQTEYLASLEGAPALESELSKRIQSLFTPQMQALAAQRGQEAANYYAAPEESRALFSNILDPVARSAAASRYTASKLQPYVGTTTALNMLGGTQDQILNKFMNEEAGARQFRQAKMTSAQGAYQSALDQFWKERQLKQEAEQAALNRANQIAIARISAASSGAQQEDLIPVTINGKTYMVKPSSYGSLSGTKRTAAEEKELNAIRSTLAVASTLKNAYMSSEDVGQGLNPLNFLKNPISALDKTIKQGQLLVPGSSLPNARSYQQNKAALVGSLKGIAGEVGRLTDQDISRMMGLLPNVDIFTTREYGAKKFSDLENQIWDKATMLGYTPADIYGEMIDNAIQ